MLFGTLIATLSLCFQAVDAAAQQRELDDPKGGMIQSRATIAPSRSWAKGGPPKTEPLGNLVTLPGGRRVMTQGKNHEQA